MQHSKRKENTKSFKNQFYARIQKKGRKKSK